MLYDRDTGSEIVFYRDELRHLVCHPYSVDNLHRMAKILGIKRCWFHSSSKYLHYDIPIKRIDEITAKCTLVNGRDILKIIKGKFQPMTTPTIDPATLTQDDHTTALLALRHINTPCPRCKGTGGYWYGSTSTWRKGIGGCAMTWDVCDTCWGSGDADRHWTDLRALQAGEEERVNDEVWSYFAQGIGTTLRGMVPALEAIAGELERMSKGRKTRPEWFYDACKILGKRLRGGLDAGQKQRESDKAIPTPSLGQLHALWDACAKWRDKVDPLCRESIYQCDRVNLACPELASDVMEVLGYANHCDGCGDRCDENECAKCKEERMPA